eukprot:s2591_g7.t1
MVETEDGHRVHRYTPPFPQLERWMPRAESPLLAATRWRGVRYLAPPASGLLQKCGILDRPAFACRKSIEQRRRLKNLTPRPPPAELPKPWLPTGSVQELPQLPQAPVEVYGPLPLEELGHTGFGDFVSARRTENFSGSPSDLQLHLLRQMPQRMALGLHPFKKCCPA